jgi:hypothetical protein
LGLGIGTISNRKENPEGWKQSKAEHNTGTVSGGLLDLVTVWGLRDLEVGDSAELVKVYSQDRISLQFVAHELTAHMASNEMVMA